MSSSSPPPSVRRSVGLGRLQIVAIESSSTDHMSYGQYQGYYHRPTLRVDIGFYTGLWALLAPFYTTMSFWLTRNFDRSSHEPCSKGLIRGLVIQGLHRVLATGLCGSAEGVLTMDPGSRKQKNPTCWFQGPTGGRVQRSCLVGSSRLCAPNQWLQVILG